MDKEPCGYFMVRVRNFAPQKIFFKGRVVSFSEIRYHSNIVNPDSSDKENLKIN